MFAAKLLFWSYFFDFISLLYIHIFKWLGSLIPVCLWLVIEIAFFFIFKRPGKIQACMVAGTGLEEITCV